VFDYSQLEKYDPTGMHKVYDNWPKMAKEAYNSGLDAKEFPEIDHIVFSGMGGSGAIGDLFAGIFSKTNFHVSVVKGYLLPKTVDSKTLVIATSVSGNTVETLSTLESAFKLNCKLIAFASGGRMEVFCDKNKIEFQKIPITHSPRASLVSFVYAILQILHSIIPISSQDIIDSIEQLEKTSKQISSSNLTEKNPALGLGVWIDNTPLIYYPWGFQAAAIRFKNSLQENAKTHAIIEDVIEASHNQIVSWEKETSIQPILIEGEGDYIKTKERWKILKEYFEHNQISYREIFSAKGNILTKLMNLIYLLDYATIYHAVNSRIDPSPVKSIDFVKERL